MSHIHILRERDHKEPSIASGGVIDSKTKTYI